MLAARNHRFRTAALLAVAAYLISTGGGLIDANRIFGQELSGGYKVSAAIFPAAQLIGAAGWLVVAVAFGTEVDWRRLRLGGTIVATTYIAVAAALLLRFISFAGDLHEPRGRFAFVASVVAAMLSALAVSMIVSGFVESRRGSTRAARLRAGAVLAIFAGLALAVGALLLQSSYAHLDQPHELITGCTLLAIGGFGIAVTGLVVALAATRPLARREAAVAGAATIAVAATLCAAGGESLIATVYPGPGSLLWASWLGVAARVTLAAAFACVALGARTITSAHTAEARA